MEKKSLLKNAEDQNYGTSKTDDKNREEDPNNNETKGSEQNTEHKDQSMVLPQNTNLNSSTNEYVLNKASSVIEIVVDNTPTPRGPLTLTGLIDELIYVIYQDDLQTSGSGCCKLSNGQIELLKQITLITLAGIGAYLYADPAKDYALSENPWLPYPSPEAAAFATCFVAQIALYISMENFVILQKKQYVPANLEDLLQPKFSKIMIKVKNIGLLIGALLSSISLSSTALSYENLLLFAWLLFSFAMFANTVLHFFPFELMINIPGYRWFMLPFEKAYKFLRFLCRSPKERYQAALNDQKIADANEIKSLICERIMNSHHLNLSKKFQFKFSPFTYKIDISDLSFSRKNLFSEIILSEGEKQTTFLDILNTCWSYIKAGISKIAFTIGGLAVTLSCGGYQANPFILMDKRLNNPLLSGLIVALPTYAFAVLLFFFGSNMGRDNINFILNAGPISLEIKLYFRTFLTYWFLTLPIIPFNAAAATELAKDSVEALREYGILDEETWDYLKEFFMLSAVAGIWYFGFNILIDGFKNAAAKISKYFPFARIEKKMIVEHNEKVMQLIDFVELIKPEKLKEGVELSEDKDIKNLVGKSRDECIAILNSEEKLDKKLYEGTFSCLSSFFYGSQHTNKKENQQKYESIKDQDDNMTKTDEQSSEKKSTNADVENQALGPKENLHRSWCGIL